MRKFPLLPVFLLGVLIPVPGTAQDALDQEVERHFQAAKDAESSRDYQKAIAEYQAVIKQRPEIAEVHTNLGLVYYLQRMDSQAIAAFRQALQLKPSMIGANL